MALTHSYAAAVEWCDVTWCQGCANGDHRIGWSDPSRGIVHWADRRFSRRGLRVFLKLVGAIVLSHNRGQETWQRLYEQNRFASQTARKMGFRLPRSYASLDRARVRYIGTRRQISQEARTWAAR